MWTCPANIYSVLYEIVGGGASGGLPGSGQGPGGGGGAGGKRTGVFSVTPGTIYTIVVGRGGAAISSPGPGNPGENSSFDTIVAEGGGRGGANTTPGGNGGNGGGAGGVGTGTAGGTGTTGQGNNGGNYNSSPDSGGGGGGPGSPGNTAGRSCGGDGTPSTITGVSVIRALGAGGAINSTSIVPKGGNNNLRGNSGQYAPGGTWNTPGAGTDGYGDGGGAAYALHGPSAKGGNGIVIIRFGVASATSLSGVTGGLLSMIGV